MTTLKPAKTSLGCICETQKIRVVSKSQTESLSFLSCICSLSFLFVLVFLVRIRLFQKSRQVTAGEIQTFPGFRQGA